MPVEPSSQIQVVISAITPETEDILSFELKPPPGQVLPIFEAGAHVDVHLPSGIIRQYSLCNDPAENGRYVIAVLKERNGRGGSRAMHDLKIGDTLTISAPRNNFPLAGSEAKHHLLLAGGIGVTPMIAMLSALEARGASYVLHYCTRSPEKTAFLKRLVGHCSAGKVVMHHDGGDPSKGLDLKALLATPKPDTHVYICGPSGFISAAQEAAAGWPSGSIHFEHFTATALTSDEAAWDAVPFKVKIKNSGKVYDVPAGCSIVNALRTHGIEVETSCEDGYCGTCLTPYVEGEPVHRDTILSDDDRKKYVIICRARSRTPMLVLDL